MVLLDAPEQPSAPIDIGPLCEAVARCAQLCGDGLCRGGDLPELRDQLVELVHGQYVVGRCCQLVGEGVDPLFDLQAGVGERAGGVDEAAAAQPLDNSGQLCLGQVAALRRARSRPP